MATPDKASAWGVDMYQTGDWGTSNGLPGTGGPYTPPTSTQKLDTKDLSGADRDAVSALVQLFNQYGLGSLAPKIVDYVRKGYGSDTIALLLQDTSEWKRRFAGNEARRKAGLAILSPQEYLATERSYRQVMQQYGLPSGFYDSPADFANFIGRDLSAQELQSRVQVASQFANSQDQSTKDALRRLYGLGPGDLAAWALDQNRAQPLIERQARAVQAGAAALRQGLGSSREVAERLADLGVTAEQAEQGYANIAEMLPVFSQLGRIYSDDYNQATAEAEVFEGSAEAARKRKGLASQERAAFGGSSRGSVGRASSSY